MSAIGVIGEGKPLTALAVCTMLEEEGGVFAPSPQSVWGRDLGPERSGDPALVAIVSSTPNITHTVHPFWHPVLEALKESLLSLGADMLVSSRSPLIERSTDRFGLERSRRRGVSGLIVLGIGIRDADLSPLVECGLPIVFIDLDAIGKRVGYVMSNNLEGMASVVRHLHRLGRSRIATITGPLHFRPAHDRLLGYRSALSSVDSEERADYVVEGDFYHRTGYEGCKRLLALADPPDAIACASDMMAAGAMLAIEEAGARVPDDIALSGFDDSHFAERMSPALTTVRQDTAGLGKAAAEELLRMIADTAEPPPTILLPTRLVVRESCGSQAGRFA
ncbi:MAG: LacI family DNA-binding transcriptional regulator [Gaiellaceae bacterium]